MTPFNPQRRDLLRVGSLGVAGAAIPAISFAAAKAGDAPASGSASAPGIGVFFNVHAYGAIGDGKTVDTPAINRAIDAAASAGGGMVLFPAGIYLSFSIRLKSNVHLHLEQGATILAADSPKPGETTGYNGGTYDAAEPKTAWDAYQDYGHNHWHNSLIWGEDLHDISITGTGLIYGKGLSFGTGPAPAASTQVRGFFTEPAGWPAAAGTTPAPPERHFDPRGDYPMYQAEQPGVGNKAIALKNCRNVQLRDFSILKGGHFGLLLTGVDNLIIDNLTIDTDRDGMDIDCCQNVRVSNCTVNSPWDDGICPKSSYSLGYARATRNVTIANCFVTGCYQLGTVLDGTWKKFPEGGRLYGTGRIKCGTESNGGFVNITIAGCVFEGCLKTSPSPTPPCATSSQGRSSCVSAHVSAAPKNPPRSAPSSASSSRISIATTRRWPSAPSLPESRVTPLKTSSSRTSTSKPSVALRPTPPSCSHLK
jgi:polygalacturonase